MIEADRTPFSLKSKRNPYSFFQIALLVGFFSVVFYSDAFANCNDKNCARGIETRIPAEVLANGPMSIPSWITQSNSLMAEYSHEFATIFPEASSQFGYTEYDKEATNLEDDMDEKWFAFYDRWAASLSDRLKNTTDRNLRADIQVLREQNTLTALKKQHVLARIKIDFGPDRIIGGLLGILWSPETPIQRKRDVIERFHRYVRGYRGALPILSAQKSNLEFQIARREPGEKLFPSKSSLQHDIDTSDSGLEVLRDRLIASGLTGWESDFSEFRNQVKDFYAYVKDRLMPLSRESDAIPVEFYLDRLNSNEINASIEELITSAVADYSTLYPEFLRLAQKVAEQNHLPKEKSDPASVMAFLRSKKAVNQNEVLTLYRRVGEEIAAIIRTQDMITIPDEPLRMRIMTSAESQLSPIPFCTIPLLGNSEKPMFLLPSAESGQTLDDFSYEAGAYTMYVHEGRPGHELQVRSFNDPAKTSKIRATWAFNSTNAEGWAMYAEAAILPYLTKEARLAGLQMRLLRIVRMMMEPQLAIGQTTTGEIAKKIQFELGFTEKWANTEAWRYSNLTGQAPSYYYGYKKLLAMKERVKKAIGPRFNNRCFNDAYIGAGLLPIDMIGNLLISSLKCRP
jgi:hypothetical protein